MTPDQGPHLLARCRDDIAWLEKGHRPGSAADAVGIARDYRKLLDRFLRLEAMHVSETCIETGEK